MHTGSRCGSVDGFFSWSVVRRPGVPGRVGPTGRGRGRPLNRTEQRRAGDDRRTSVRHDQRSAEDSPLSTTTNESLGRPVIGHGRRAKSHPHTRTHTRTPGCNYSDRVCGGGNNLERTLVGPLCVEYVFTQRTLGSRRTGGGRSLHVTCSALKTNVVFRHDRIVEGRPEGESYLVFLGLSRVLLVVGYSTPVPFSRTAYCGCTHLPDTVGERIRPPCTLLEDSV